MTSSGERLPADLEARIGALDWADLEQELWGRGYVKTSRVLTRAECDGLVALYEDNAHFRKRVVMERHGYGVGEYKYFKHPLPAVVQTLRRVLYDKLAPLANRWMAALKTSVSYPEDLESFLAVCRDHGQTLPTPLLLHYPAGGYNCLHRDLYGEVAFPLQATCFLSRAETDYRGGAFVLVEQRPRSQSYAECITTQQGELVIFPTQFRPAVGRRGYRKTSMRHGVSRVVAGVRDTLGIIFHDAK